MDKSRDQALRKANWAAVCSLIAAGLAALSFWSWGAGVIDLLTPAPQQIPMAPGTALLLILLSLAVLQSCRCPIRRQACRFVPGIAVVVAVVGVLVCLRHGLGWSSPIEEWLAQVNEQMGRISVGHISPLAGALFVAVALALVLRLPRLARRSFCGRISGLIALAVALVSVAGVASHTWGKPWQYGPNAIVMALWTAVAFAFLSLALLVVGSPRNAESPAAQSLLDGSGGVGRRSYSRNLLLVVGPVTLVLGVLTSLYLRHEQARSRAIARDMLHAIGDLKMGQIAQWRRERLAEGNFLLRTPYVARRALDVLTFSSSLRTQQMFTDWLDSLHAGGPIEQVFLLDDKFNIRLVHPQGAQRAVLGEAAERSAETALRTREVVLGELHRATPDAPVQLDVSVPFVVRREGTNDNVPAAGTGVRPTDRSAAVLVLKINAHKSLYPILESWPTPSPTAETLLVAREGDEVVFLNELRHRTNSALRCRFPLSTTNDQSAARAVLGQTGPMGGRDYRGVPVLADVRPVPDSKWFLIAKVDRDEIYGPLRQQAWLTLALTAIMVVAAGLLAGLLSKRREMAFTRRELDAERERLALAQRVEHLMKHASDAILLADEQDRIVEANERMLQGYGYTAAELHGANLSQLRAPEARANFAAESAQVLAAGQAVFETRHRRKDGTVFPVEISSNVIEIDGRRYKLGILRDITERKTHEREIERLNRLYLTLSEVNQTIVRVRSRAELFQDVCRIAVECGGFRLAWVGWPEAGTAQVRPVAHAGVGAEHLQGVRVFADDRPEGGGLAGQCLRSGQTCLSQDVTTDPRTTPWHDLARTHGIRGAAALPIRQRGEVGGVFIVYVSEAAEFQAQEIKLLEEMAVDISFALDQLEQRAEHQAAECALRESEELYRSLIAASPNAITLTDLAGRTLFTSARALEMFGEGPDTDLTGRSVLDWVVPEERARALENVRRLPGNGQLLETEYTMLRPDGSRFAGEVTVAVFRAGDGSPKGKIVITRDISERKRAELIRETLLEVGRQLSAAQEPRELAHAIFQAADRLWKWDAGTVDVYAAGNDHMQVLLNYDTLADGRRTEVPAVEPLFAPTARMRRIMTAGPELILRRASDEKLPDAVAFGDTTRLSAAIMCVPLRSHGHAVGVWSIQSYTPNAFTEQDLQILQVLADHCGGALERLRAEQALRESETRLRSLSDNLPNGMLYQLQFRPDGRRRFNYVSETVRRMYGCSPEEARADATRLFGRIHAEDRAQMREARNRATAACSLFSAEARIHQPDGSVRWSQFASSPRRLADGSILWDGIEVDITERKKLEAKLRHQELLAREAGEIAHVGGWEFDPITLEGDWTEETARIHDLDPAVPINVMQRLEYYQGDSRVRIEAAVKDALERGIPFDLELEILSARGRHKWVRSICHPVVENGKVVRVRGSYQDITKRKRWEEREHLHLHTLQLLATGAALPEVLESIVALLECDHPDWRCAILLTDDTGRRLVPGAASRRLDAFACATEGIAIAEGAGACGNAAATRQLTVVEDLAQHPHCAATCGAAQRAGIRACWAQPILSPDGEVLGTIAMYHTESCVPRWEEVRAVESVVGLASIAIEKRRGETALRASEERFRSLYENSTVGIYRTTPAGRVLLANPALVKLLGYGDFAELAERDLTADGFEPAYARQSFVEQIERDGEIRGLEAAWKRRDGTTIFVRETARAVRDAAGRTLYYDGVIEDVSQRKQAEDQLRKLSRAVEQSPASIVITDRTGQIEYVNPKFTELTGYTFAEVQGQNPRVLKSGEASADQYQHLWETITRGGEWRGEFHNRKKNGELFWEAASISPIFDDAGCITHFLAVKEDITERKRLEAQFRQAQKMEAVGQLAGGVAHDFNNILAAIMLHLGLLRDVPNLDPFLAGSLKELEAEAKRAAGLTRQLLQFSRRSIMQVKPLDLNDVVENLLKMLRRLIGEQISLDWRGGSNLPTVSGDVGMMEQVILNLVVNARDAIAGGGRVTIATQLVEFDELKAAAHPDARPGSFVCLEISDNGAGMEESVLKRIFEPFFTTKEAGKGTGLGLATVYGIAHQHQGWITVESEPGQGSAFRVFFPAMAGRFPDAEAAESALPPPRGRETVLLVEDEPSLRKSVGNFLRQCGYQIIEAANGPEALSYWALHWQKIDLVFTDMVMPGGVSGLQLTQKLRANKSGLKVIISSGYSTELLQESDLAGLGILFLPKPCPPDELARAVRRCLDQPVG